MTRLDAVQADLARVAGGPQTIHVRQIDGSEATAAIAPGTVREVADRTIAAIKDQGHYAEAFAAHWTGPNYGLSRISYHVTVTIDGHETPWTHHFLTPGEVWTLAESDTAQPVSADPTESTQED